MSTLVWTEWSSEKMGRIAASHKIFLLVLSHICSIWFLSFIHIFCSINKAVAFIWRFCDPTGFKFPVSCFHFTILKMSLVSSLKCFYCSFSPDVVDCNQLCFKAIAQQPFMPCCTHHVSNSFSVNCQEHWKLNCQDLRWMKSNLTGRNYSSHVKKTSIHSFWEILGLFEPTQECGSVGIACSKGTLRPRILWSAQQTSRKAFHSWVFL